MKPPTAVPPVGSPVLPHRGAEIAGPRLRRFSAASLSSLIIVAAATLDLPNAAEAAEPSQNEATIERRVQELIPEIEAYIADGMKAVDVPGLAIGIVANDTLTYAKGFGVRSKS